MSKIEEDIKQTSQQLRFARSLNPQNYRVRGGSLHEWIDTHWQRLEGRAIERQALSWLAKHAPEKANEKAAASAVATAILHLPELPLARKNCIPVLNGTVDISETGAILRTSKKEDALDYVLDCSFDPNAKSPIFDAFLEQALPSVEVRGFLQEYAGYTLLSDTRHQLAAWLIGQGGTGKGTFAQIMQSMHRQTVALSLDALDGFKLAGLQSASLVLVDETPQRIDEQKLKTLISGDAIQVDVKYRDPLTIRPTAKWLVNGNALPAISDHSSGFWRRWLIFPFNVVPTQKIPLLAETIVDDELLGVLNWCVAGLMRLLLREQFPPLPSEMAAAAAEGKQSSNNVAEWIEDCGIATDNKCRNTRRDIYLIYSMWCSESGTRAVSAKKFWERLVAALPDIEFDRTSTAARTRTVNIPLPPGSGL